MPTRRRREERVCVSTRPDATTEPGPERGTQKRTDGRAGRSEARQRGDRTMSQMSLKDAAAKVTSLGSKDLAWIYRQLASGKPMRLAKRPEILTAVMGSLQQGA